jgi:protoporphyrinogen oxidase
MNTINNFKKIAIIGGGISGLTTAWSLASVKNI